MQNQHFAVKSVHSTEKNFDSASTESPLLSRVDPTEGRANTLAATPLGVAKCYAC